MVNCDDIESYFSNMNANAQDDIDEEVQPENKLVYISLLQVIVYSKEKFMKEPSFIVKKI